MTHQRVILAWSEPDLRDWRQGDVVIPLTAEAHVAAIVTLTGSIVDPKRYLDDPAAVRINATQLLNVLHLTLKGWAFPWFEAYANVIFHVKVFQLIAWLQLIRAVRTAFSPSPIEIRPPTGFSRDLFIDRLAQRSFDLAREILRSEGIRFTGSKPSVPWRTRLRRSSVVGRILAATLPIVPRLRKTQRVFRETGGPDATAARQQKTDVVLVSQQYTDAFHATRLATQLGKEVGDRFLWLGMRPQIAPGMTHEEVALVAGVNLEDVRFVDSAALENVSSTADKLVDLGSAWKVAGLLPLNTELRMNRAQWFEFLMDPDLRGLGSRYQVWGRFLDDVQPKLVVGLSSLQDMALVRAWARRNRVPFVGLMHGVFPSVDCSYHVDADYLGVFGKVLAGQVKAADLPQPRLVKACGAMQFGDKASAVSGVRSGREAQSTRDAVLFLGGYEWLPFCPWAPSEMWAMLRDIHEVCREFGKILRVRPHPRSPSSVLTPYIELLRKEHPDTIVVSMESSIRQDFSSAELVVAAGFDGAVLDALFDHRLVMCYVPEGTKPGLDVEPFETMKAIAYGYSALRHMFSTMVTNPDSAADVHQLQDDFLRGYIAELGRNPWRGALDLIYEALRDSASDRRLGRSADGLGVVRG